MTSYNLQKETFMTLVYVFIEETNILILQVSGYKIQVETIFSYHISRFH